MERLHSPWRFRYVSSAHRKTRGCVFCRAARSRRDRNVLVVYRGSENFIILNKYPYNNGHLMIVPFAHIASLQEATAETLTEMIALAAFCEGALRSSFRPSGINIGMNLGRSAGAGIEPHLHLHLVPRWDGDTNFMTSIHGTRVIPEALRVTYRRLRPLFRRLETPSALRPARRRASHHHRKSR